LNLAQKTVLRSKNFAFIVVYFVKMKTPCFKRGRPDVASLLLHGGDQMLLRFCCMGED